MVAEPMKIICLSRGKGKTAEIIKIAASGGYYIVCINHEECSRVFNLARDMKLVMPFPITMQEFIEGKFCSRGIKGFCIDNIEVLLTLLGRGVPIQAISFTKEI